MCTETCPCHYEEEHVGSSSGHASLMVDSSLEYLAVGETNVEMYGRTIEEEPENEDLIPFTWSANRSESVETYMDCLNMWEERYTDELTREHALELHFNLTSLFHY